jgi:hypothetical protein
MQMHIHIARFDSQRTAPGVDSSNWLVRKLARAEQLSTSPASPTRILGEGFYDVQRFSSTPLGRPPRDWARVYAVFVPTADPVRDLGVSGVLLLAILLPLLCECMLQLQEWRRVLPP